MMGMMVIFFYRCLSWNALSVSSSSTFSFFGCFKGFFLPPSRPIFVYD